jgi:PAS domain S-box-containing protein/putative nucleotidyltransferase with HDIG domain
MGKPLRVLIIEDSEDDELLILRALRQDGYEVESERVDTAPKMQSALNQKTWDLILSDFSMPEFNAPQALELLKASGLDLPFIIVSGTIGEETAVAALKAGANDFLVKGKFSRLGPAIEREMREAESRRERRRAEEQLQYQAYLLSNVNDAIIASDENYLITFWNRAAESLYGWSAEETLGKFGPDITKTEFPGQDADEIPRHIRETGLWRGEVTQAKKDGTRFPCEISSLMLRDEKGAVAGYISINHDITERKRAEEAVRESERQYRSLFEDSPISLWVEDLSEIKRRLDQLKASGIEDIPAYLHEHLDFVIECANQVRVLDVNSTSVKLYHARSKTELLGSLTHVLPAIPVEQFERELIQIASGQLNFELESVDETLTGEKIHVSLRWTVAPGYEDTLARVIVSTIDITEQKRAEEQTQLQVQRLRSLRVIDVAISSSFNLNLTLDILLDQVITQLSVDAASILLFQPIVRGLEHAASRGFRTAAIREAKVKLGEGYAGKALLERRMIHSSNLTETDGELPPAFLLMVKEEGFIDYYGVPLLVKGEAKGVLEIFHRSPLPGGLEWLDFLETLAGQAAIAIEDSTLFENLQRSNQELFQAYDATIEGWSRALDLRDNETEGHTLRVTELTLELARKFGFSDEQLINIRWGALLHDIGKMGVPDNILLKPDKLNEAEWEIMKNHPGFALEMLSPIGFLKSSLDIPYCHHEKWDGSGYPRGLIGEVIPLAARLFAVVDVWDALRSDRPYRKGWAVKETIEYIRSHAGSHFDPKIVEYFLEMVEQGNGK